MPTIPSTSRIETTVQSVHHPLIDPFWAFGWNEDVHESRLDVWSPEAHEYAMETYHHGAGRMCAVNLGKFFMNYARENHPDELLEYTMANKKQAKKKETQEVRAGNVKARIYPDGRVCLEHEAGMEELWIPADDIGSLVDCIGSVAEATGARPTSGDTRQSGVSYDQERLEPGQIMPVGALSPSPGLANAFGSLGSGLVPSQLSGEPRATATQVAIDQQRQHLVEHARQQAIMAQERELQRQEPSPINEKDFNAFLEYAMQLGEPQKYVSAQGWSTEPLPEPETPGEKKGRLRDSLREGIEKMKGIGWKNKRKRDQ